MPGAPSFNYLPQMISGQHQAFGTIYNAIQAQAAKISVPGILQVRRFRAGNEFVGDLIYDIEDGELPILNR